MKISISNLLKNKFTIIVGIIIISVIAGVFSMGYKHYKAINIIDTVDTINISNVDTMTMTKLEEDAKNANQSENAKAKNKDKDKDIDIIKSANTIPKKVLELAVTAYKTAENKALVDNHKLTIIDYSQPSSKKRMWVIDMDKKKVDLNTYVSHGVGSGGKVATDFSNKPESHKTSIGVMKTGGTYIGKRGKSLYLHGLEKNINDNVYKRHVVIHGASYVSENIARSAGQVGKSFGCPAVDTRVAKTLINKIAGGSIVFAYYPNSNWISHSRFL